MSEPVDAIVVGAGAAGGVAAMQLAEAGLRVAVLEAGPCKGVDSPSRRWAAAALDLAERVQPKEARKAALKATAWMRHPVQSRSMAWHEAPRMFVDDLDNPYVSAQGRPFSWVRARRRGGRMLLPGHGRVYMRMSREELAPWPFPAETLDPWYELIESRLGLAGRRDGLEQPPDSAIARPLEPTADEARLMGTIERRWPTMTPILGRYAPPLDGIAAAAATGRLELHEGAIARSVLHRAGKVQGVEWIDARHGGDVKRLAAPLVFLCASTLETTRLLMLSFGAAASWALGRFLMDHVKVLMRAWAPALQ
jgi:choline dehydrogenase-like flavoprotein